MITRKYFEELCITCRTLAEMAVKVGCHRTYLSTLADRLNVDRSLLPRGKRGKDSYQRTRRPKDYNFKQRKTVIQSYLTNCSVRAVKIETGFARSTVRKILHRAGFEIPDPGGATKIKRYSTINFHKEIRDELEQSLIGLLLSDGYIDVANRTQVSLVTTDEYQELLEDLADLSKRRITENSIPRIVAEYNRIQQTLRKAKIGIFQLHMSYFALPLLMILKEWFETESYRVRMRFGEKSVCLATEASIQLYLLYKRFYPNNKKIIPKNFKLTPIVLFFMYIGDGSRDGDLLRLCTHSFSKPENEFLATRLDDLRIWSHVRSYAQNGKTYWVTYINRGSNKTFFSYFNQFQSKPLSDFLSLAKQLYPWKFQNLQKKDVYDKDNKFVDSNYLQTFLGLLKGTGVNISERTKRYLFPWLNLP
ncbi:MAG: hypothetical protein ACFFBD_07790 [Candidatus Hodarchaeota archaeon]